MSENRPLRVPKDPVKARAWLYDYAQRNAAVKAHDSKAREVMAKAINDPNAVVGPRQDGESLAAWQARACDLAIGRSRMAVMAVDHLLQMSTAMVELLVYMSSSSDPEMRDVALILMPTYQFMEGNIRNVLRAMGDT